MTPTTFEKFLEEKATSTVKKDKYAWDEGDFEQDDTEVLEEKKSPKLGSHYDEPTKATADALLRHVPSQKAHDHAKKIVSSLKDNDHRAMSNYTGYGYDGINKALRNGKNHSQTKHLDKFTSNKLNEDHHVYRSFGGTLDPRHLKAGTKIHDKGYMSTSHSYKISSYFRRGDQSKVTHKVDDENHVHVAIAKIHVPKGTKGFYVDHGGSHLGAGEREVILHRGTTLKVTGHSVHTRPHPSETKTQVHTHIVHMTVHHQE